MVLIIMIIIAVSFFVVYYNYADTKIGQFIKSFWWIFIVLAFVIWLAVPNPKDNGQKNNKTDSNVESNDKSDVFEKDNVEKTPTPQQTIAEINEAKCEEFAYFCDWTNNKPCIWFSFYDADMDDIKINCSIHGKLYDSENNLIYDKERNFSLEKYQTIQDDNILAIKFFINVDVEDFGNVTDGYSVFKCDIVGTESNKILFEDVEIEIDLSKLFLELTPTPSPSPTPTPIPEKEIVFSGVPWGTSYTETNKMLDYLGLWNLSGEGYKTYSIDDIVLGDYQGIDFEYSDINIIGNTFYGEVDVAGYTTTEVNLYFAYLPVNGVLTKTEDDSALYGAQYIFEPLNLEEMTTDLIEKISSLYGEADDETSTIDWFDIEYNYTYWYGSNDTAVVLKSVDASNDTTELYKDEIVISYVWLKGDELLQAASDTLKLEAEQAEAEGYGNGSTSGL